MFKKILLFAVLAGILLGAVACTDPQDKEKPDDTTEGVGSVDTEDISGKYDEHGYLLDDIPAGTNFGDAEVTFFHWSDHTMKEFYSDSLSGDLIGDEIYKRNDIVENRLGVRLNYVSAPGNDKNVQAFVQKAQIDVSSGTCEFDIIAGYSRTPPLMALTGGLIEDLTELDYLDFEKPWWPELLVDQCLINDSLYFCSGDISTNLLWMTVATFYSKSLIETQNLDDPYQLVKDNKWTLDKLISMSQNKYEDKNGNGVADDGDFYGYVIYDINTDAFFTAAGFLALEKNNSGDIVVSPKLEDQVIYNLIDKLGDWYTSSNDVRNANSTSIRNIFFDERAIFTMDRVFIVAGKDTSSTPKIEFEYGILPNPKYDEYQENYITNIGHPYTMYAISTGAFDTNACAAVIECLASESYRRVTPVIFETAMKVKYASDPNAAEMYDILRSTASFDLGRLYSNQIGDVYKEMRAQVHSNAKTFASQYKALSKVIENGIKLITNAYFE